MARCRPSSKRRTPLPRNRVAVKLVQPWPDGYTVNARSPYGPRIHPITKRRTFHHGIDVAMPVGTQLTAPADGIVAHKGKSPSGGHTLILRHDNNLHTVYYHLQSPSPLPVGHKVSTGDPIAKSGNTGASTGPHLHLEVRRSRKWGDTQDPQPFIVPRTVEPEPVQPLAEPVQPEPLQPEPVTPQPVTPTPRPEPVKLPSRPTPLLPSVRPTKQQAMSAKLRALFAGRRNLK